MKYLIHALLAALVLITSLAAHAQPPVTLGVFALRPEPLVQAMWQPFADYLGAGLEREVRLRVLDAAAMHAAIARNELDLVLTNPTHLVELRTLSPLSGAIATQLDLQAGQAVSQFGGVILVRRDTPACATSPICAASASPPRAPTSSAPTLPRPASSSSPASTPQRCN